MQQQKLKRTVIVQMQKWYDECPKSNREGRGQQERESAFVSQEIQSIKAKQVLFLIMPTCHWSTGWKSGYTSLEKTKRQNNINTHSCEYEMLYLLYVEPN